MANVESMPEGTVTLLFSDVEGSTGLLTRLGEQYASVLDLHRRLMREAWSHWHGVEMGTEGDGFYVAFGSATAAVGAAMQAQRSLASEPWPAGDRVRVRIGIHTGEPMRHGDAYVGLDVHRAARITAAARGGQTLLSEPTRLLLAAPGEGLSLKDLGWHRLKDFPDAMRLFQAQPAELAETTFPPPRTLGSISRLPSLEAPPLGRADDLVNLAHLVAPRALVTLTGPGGAGKTTLAIALAGDLGPAFEDGVHFVSLTDVETAGAMWGELARQLDEQGWNGRPAQLLEAIGGRHMLLILDNLEQVPDAAAVVSELRARVPRACIVATSRRPLHAPGEHDYPVAPLGLPAAATLAAAHASPAVDVFVQTARAVRPSFVLNDDNAPDVTAICERLDGLPLAIELAASRSKLMSPRALRERLDSVDGLLSIRSPTHGRPRRQRTLRDTIAVSYELLSDVEQATFRRLGALHGGDLAAVAVAASLPPGHDLLDVLGELCDASLVEVSDGPDGQPRTRLLETVHAFALERLSQAQEEDTTRRRLAEHFVGEVAGLARQIVTVGGYLQVRSRLDPDLDNVRAALGWALDADDPDAWRQTEIALTLAVGLAQIWGTAGHYTEGVEALERAIARAGDDEVPGLAKALYEFAMRNTALDPTDAIAVQRRALELFRITGDHSGSALALLDVGILLTVQHNAMEPGRAALDEAFGLAKETADDATLALVSLWYGVAEQRVGDLNRAVELAMEGQEAAERAGDEELYLTFETKRATLDAMGGRANEALKRLHTVAARIVGRGDRWGVLNMLHSYSAAYAALGHVRMAARLAGAVERLRVHELGVPLWQADWDPIERFLGVARRRISSEEWERERQAGMRLTFAEALAEADRGAVSATGSPEHA